jgi:hypothetical protein
MTDRLSLQPPMTRSVQVSHVIRVPGGGSEVAPKGLALFHCFSSDYEELNEGVGIYPVAIVEWPAGRVEAVPIHLIQFIKES